jgi:hypothetical protein
MTASVTLEPPKWLWLHAEDNVAMALSDFTKGSSIDVDGINVVFHDDVEYGHKFALREIPTGEPVIKFAETIGVAKREIRVGEHVHVHNVQSLRARKQ